MDVFVFVHASKQNQEKRKEFEKDEEMRAQRERERDDLMIKGVSKGANMTKRREEWGGWRGFGLGKRELERAGKTETDHLKVMREGPRR